MITVFWVLFGLALVGLAVFFGLTVRDIWLSLKRLGAAGSAFTEAFGRFALTTTHSTDVVVYPTDAERRSEALATRRRIADERDEARERRLDSAVSRWDTTQDEFEDRFTDDYRAHARARRQGRDR